MTPQKFKKIQRKLGLTNKNMAKKLGVSEPTIDKWRSGAIKIPMIAVKLIEFIMPTIPIESTGNLQRG